MADPNPTVISAGTALLGPDLQEVQDAVIVVDGGTVLAAGHRDEVELPPSAAQVVTNGTVIPGFIDAHVHIGFADPRDVLRGGVTTVRDLGWPRPAIYPMSERSRTSLEWPLIVAAGPMLTVPGGYPMSSGWAPPGTGVAIESPAAAREEVNALKTEGAVIVKIALNPVTGPVLSDELLEAIVSEAHSAGLKVTGHIDDLEQLERAVSAGIDELAHMLLSGEALPDEMVTAMVHRGVAIVPTLSIFPKRDARVAVANLALFIERGGTVVYGTDLGNAGPRPGIDPTEVARMGAAGMSAIDIVRAATVTAASWLGLRNKGVLAPGMDADLVVLEGPINDGAGLNRIEMVMRGGRVAA